MVLGQISIHGFIAGEREADACSDEAVRFLGGILADDGESDLPELDVLQSFAAGDQLAVGREDRGDTADVACRNACVPEGELKARKSFTMFTDAFGEKNFLSDERHGAGLPCLRLWGGCETFSRCGKVTRRYCKCQRISDSERRESEKNCERKMKTPQRVRGLANPIRQEPVFRHFCRGGKKMSNRFALPNELSNLPTRNHVPILISPRILIAPPESISVIRPALTRRRGPVFNSKPA